MWSRVVLLASLASAAAACSASDDVPAPVAGSLVPDHGVPGTIVDVSGAYFCQEPPTGSEDPTCASTGDVVFGTTPATPTTWADNAIMVEVPSTTAGDTDVAVEVRGRRSNTLTFTVE